MADDLQLLADADLLELKSELSDESYRVRNDRAADERVRLRIWAVDEELERRGFFGDGA